METPVFEEFDPASDCDCPGCLHWRRVSPRFLPAGIGGHPAAHRALVVATAASAALGAGHVVPALAAPHADRPGVPVGDGPQTPQGHKAPLHGPGGKPAFPADTVKVPATTRAEIIRRAQTWVAAQVPYSMSAFWSDGYRQDCSGYVSMAWGLTGNEWTGSLHQFATRIAKEDLQLGDMLLFHNPANPQNGSHVVLFGGWTDSTHTYYVVYEQTRPTTRRLATPYAYWTNSDHYVPYRYKGITAGTATQDPGGKAPGVSAGGSGGSGGSGGGTAGSAAPASAYPGSGYFGPGANNKFVTLLGRLLVERGADHFYATGPGPRWSEADRRATQAFQLAQGWRGANADGLPGPGTWRLLATGAGKDIPVGAAGPPAPTPARPAPSAGGSASAPARPAPAATRVPAYPGRGMFRPGADNAYVTQLGRQLARKGFGRFYATGPGPRWGEADRRGVEAFQRAQGWRGGAADGYPGPETWRRLFS